MSRCAQSTLRLHPVSMHCALEIWTTGTMALSVRRTVVRAQPPHRTRCCIRELCAPAAAFLAVRLPPLPIHDNGSCVCVDQQSGGAACRPTGARCSATRRQAQSQGSAPHRLAVVRGVHDWRDHWRLPCKLSGNHDGVSTSHGVTTGARSCARRRHARACTTLTLAAQCRSPPDGPAWLSHQVTGRACVLVAARHTDCTCSYMAIMLADRPATMSHTFGFHRVEVRTLGTACPVCVSVRPCASDGAAPRCSDIGRHAQRDADLGADGRAHVGGHQALD